MCLATEPQLLLLDEPLAGMGSEESLRMVELIRQLAGTHAVLLVEHDMDAVFQLAQKLTVMVDGKVLASGAPAAVRANRDVQNAPGTGTNAMTDTPIVGLAASYMAPAISCMASISRFTPVKPSV
jgi:ABC-type uncharacterized transport system ATPase subunit